MSVDRILLTNDDGIDTVGFRAMYEALADDYEVIAVAPADDQSAIGRAISNEVRVQEHELGFVIHGTPVDCVVAGLGELVPDAEMVVAGCNKGANLGEYVLGRSGTVSAAVEAAFFDVPAIATSMYIPGGDDWWRKELSGDQYGHATSATRYLVDNALDAGVFDQAEYLNVNAPMAGSSDDANTDTDIDAQAGVTGHAPLEVTRPSSWYGMDATREDDEITLRDSIWDRMREGDIPDPEGTDRRAVVEGRVSVSPLTAPHTTQRHDALEGIAMAYSGNPVEHGR